MDHLYFRAAEGASISCGRGDQIPAYRVMHHSYHLAMRSQVESRVHDVRVAAIALANIELVAYPRSWSHLTEMDRDCDLAIQPD